LIHSRSAPYVFPFAAFLAFLAVGRYLPGPAWAVNAVWIAAIGAVLWHFSRRAISWRPVAPWASAAAGVAVFLLWIAPDLLWPGYRSSWLFQNSLTGSLASSLAPASRGDALVLSLRSLRAVLIVPIVEELFWRGWLLRWIEGHDFESVPVGHWNMRAFGVTAALFAVEHGPFWDVGLIAGAIYNGWVVRTKSIADCVLAHAVTNACLCGYVIATGEWQYWL
jgi:CAAX prenyl protease-like protein